MLTSAVPLLGGLSSADIPATGSSEEPKITAHAEAMVLIAAFTRTLRALAF